MAHDRPDLEGAQGGSSCASSMVDEAELPFFKARSNGSAHALREMRAMLDDDERGLTAMFLPTSLFWLSSRRLHHAPAHA